jgi:methanogenic corrinoid protein MtbC1
VTTFGKNLRHYRKQKGMNQRDLGNAVGVGQTTIANYEKGIRVPSIKLINQIKTVLGISVEDLLSDRDNIELIVHIGDGQWYRETLMNILLQRSEEDIHQVIGSLKPNAYNFSEIMDEIITPVMYEIGSLWMGGHITVAEEHAATEKVISLIDWMTADIKPLQAKSFKVLSMAYTSEYHTLGMKMVSSFLKIRGFGSIYLGNNLPTYHLIQYLLDEKPDLLLLSVTLLSQLEGVKNMIDVIREVTELSDLTIVIGGQATKNDPIDNQGVMTYQGNLKGLETWIELSVMNKSSRSASYGGSYGNDK